MVGAGPARPAGSSSPTAATAGRRSSMSRTSRSGRASKGGSTRGFGFDGATSIGDEWRRALAPVRPRQTVRPVVRTRLPDRLTAALLELAEVEPGRRWPSSPASTEAGCWPPLTEAGSPGPATRVIGRRRLPVEESSLAEIDPRTLESRRHPGLYLRARCSTRSVRSAATTSPGPGPPDAPPVRPALEPAPEACAGARSRGGPVGKAAKRSGLGPCYLITGRRPAAPAPAPSRWISSP